MNFIDNGLCLMSYIILSKMIYIKSYSKILDCNYNTLRFNTYNLRIKCLVFGKVSAVNKIICAKDTIDAKLTLHFSRYSHNFRQRIIPNHIILTQIN